MSRHELERRSLRAGGGIEREKARHERPSWWMRGGAARAGGAAEVREVAGRGARLVKTTAVEFGDGNCQYEEQHQPRPERNKTARRAPCRSDGGACAQAHLPTSLRREPRPCASQTSSCRVRWAKSSASMSADEKTLQVCFGSDTVAKTVRFGEKQPAIVKLQ